MQNASKAYKESMARSHRNRGYIRVSIGVINSEAQKAVNADDPNNSFLYYSNPTSLFNGYAVDKIYATPEKDFSKPDGTMYFPPKPTSGMEYYNNGLVTKDFAGSIHIRFDIDYGLDIKGLKINWGEHYPIDFTIENDEGVHSYTGNNLSVWTTEDVFENTTFLIIRVSKMENEYLRTRIYEFSCGVVNLFTNNEIMSFSLKEFVSPISETVPSQDTTVIVDNKNLYYSPDNPESALAFMEVGQEIKVEFGYDVDGKGNVEWLPPFITYLKTWSADDSQAKFTGTDRFDYLTGKYYRGHYYPDGISLYDLAVDVLADSGITDSREYFLDPYLRSIIVYNPMPVVTHAEALQIIANAGRCALSADRQKRIHMQSSFVPEMTAVSNGEAAYSKVNNILNDDPKMAYAVCSNDFSVVDGTLYFAPKDPADYFENLGYVSDAIADSAGNFETNPVITITLEASFVAYGLTVIFRNIAPQEFVVRTYNQSQLVQENTYTNPDVNFITSDQFDAFTVMEIEFTKGHPNARIFVDNILVNNVTDYYLRRSTEILKSPTATRQNKVKSINIERTLYGLSKNSISELKNEELTLPTGETEYTVYFTKASYNYAVAVTDKDGNATGVICEIADSNNFYVVLRFSNIPAEDTVIKYTITGLEYEVDYNWLVIPHNDTGEIKEWSNPLVSTIQHGKDLEEWLASYYLGDVIYQVQWRGDPRVDANDLYYLETKDRGMQLVRGYENDLQFKGSWSSTLKARRAVLTWN